MLRKFTWAVVFIFSLSSCQKKKPETYTWTVPPDQTNADPNLLSGPAPKLVTEYLLYSAESDGTKGPASKTPFAVLIGISTDSFSRCTATHLLKGKVLTNAHCINSSIKITDHFLIYWNKSGKVSWTRAKKLANIGSESSVDAAVLEIPDTAANEWDVFGPDVTATKTFIGATLGKYQTGITMWAMNHYGSSGYYYSELKKKDCKATPRTKMVTYGTKTDGTTFKLNYGEDESYQIFYDSCSPASRKGNSGSLLTESSTNRAIGVHFAADHLELLRDRGYTSVELTGSDGVTRTFSTSGDGFVTGTGVAMDYLVDYFHLN